MIDAPTLTTPRLIVRPFMPTDAPAYLDLARGGVYARLVEIQMGDRVEV